MQASGRIEGVVDGILRGWAWDASGIVERLEVVVLADGRRIGQLTANRLRGDLRRSGIGDGAHGLECPLPLGLQDGAEHDFVFRLDGGDAAVDIARARIAVERRLHLLHGKLERLDQSRLVGWISDRARPEATIPVEVVVEGKVLASGPANHFRRDLLNAGIGSGAHGFVFDLSVLRPYPPGGAVITLRAGAEFDHWELGRASMPDAPKEAPAPAPAKVLSAARQALADAREAERRRDFPLAAKLLDAGLAKARRDFDLLAIRARVALALNEPDDAVRFARAALSVQPGHARPILILARVASARGEHAEAVDLWAGIGPTEDNYRERLLKRGRSLMAVGRPLDALGEFAAAVALDGRDRDALRAAAETAQAIGALRAAQLHWRRYARVVPEDSATAERLREIAQRFPVPEALPSPLRNATLRGWPGAVEGMAGAHPAEPSPWVRVRSLALAGGTLGYAVTGGNEVRPGDLPVYGLLLRAEGGGAEAAFALDAAAREDLARGLRMGAEVASDTEVAVEVLLTSEAGPARRLAAAALHGRPRLLAFDLRLDAAELAMLERGRLWIAVRQLGAGSLRVMPPRPMCRLPAEAAAAPGNFEDRALADSLALLGATLRFPPAGSAHGETRS